MRNNRLPDTLTSQNRIRTDGERVSIHPTRSWFPPSPGAVPKTLQVVRQGATNGALRRTRRFFNQILDGFSETPPGFTFSGWNHIKSLLWMCIGTCDMDRAKSMKVGRKSRSMELSKGPDAHDTTIPGVTTCDGPLNNRLVQSHSKRQGGRETHMKEYHAVMAVVHIIIAKYSPRK